MAPVTRGKGNCYGSLHDVYEHEELVCGEQDATQWQHMEEQYKAMRDQIEALTTQLSNTRGPNVRHHRPPLHASEEEDEDGYGYESENPFVERCTHGRQPSMQAHANWWESEFKLDVPKSQ